MAFTKHPFFSLNSWPRRRLRWGKTSGRHPLWCPVEAGLTIRSDSQLFLKPQDMSPHSKT